MEDRVFQQAILQFLHGKTRIITTNRLFPEVDRILYFCDGQLKFNGTYAQLQGTQLELELQVRNPVLSEDFDPRQLDLPVVETDATPMCTPPLSPCSPITLNAKTIFAHSSPSKFPSSRRSGKGLLRLNSAKIEQLSLEGIKWRSVRGFLRYSCGCALVGLVLVSLLPPLLNLAISEWLRRYVLAS